MLGMINYSKIEQVGYRRRKELEVSNFLIDTFEYHSNSDTSKNAIFVPFNCTLTFVKTSQV